MGTSALRSVALEICIRPANGSLISRTRKSAADADNAKTNSAAMSVGLRWVNKLKLAKMIASQKIRTARNGMGIELSEGISAGISLTDNGSFFVPYVMDQNNPARLVLGTDSIYETTNKVNKWTVDVTPGTNGFNPFNTNIPA